MDCYLSAPCLWTCQSGNGTTIKALHDLLETPVYITGERRLSRPSEYYCLHTVRQPQRWTGDEQVIDQYRDIADRDVCTGGIETARLIDISFSQICYYDGIATDDIVADGLS